MLNSLKFVFAVLSFIYLPAMARPLGDSLTLEDLNEAENVCLTTGCCQALQPFLFDRSASADWRMRASSAIYQAAAKGLRCPGNPAGQDGDQGPRGN